jgi:hypothetical protein
MGFLPLAILLLTGGTDTPASPDNPGTVPTAPPINAPAPITGKERLDWAVKSTIGPGSLMTGVVEAEWGTLFNRPKEYGEGINGTGKRFGLRLSSVGTSNLLEAGLGAIWGEDPRYRVGHVDTARGHLSHAWKMTFLADRVDGTVAPAYARYIAYAASNAVSEAWRPDSQRTVGNTTLRIGERFAGRLVGNIFKEYWPSLKQHSFLNKH